MHPQNISISGVILAGGRSSRMGGNDKGLLSLNNRPMIEYVLDTLRPQVDEVLINANRNLEAYSRFGHRVINDEIEGFAGPLAGMAAAIQACKSDYVLSVPCDGPWVPKDLASRLLTELIGADARISTAHDGQRLQPVFALIHRDLLPAILAYLESGERRLGFWIKQQQHAIADFSDQPEVFFNVNSPMELKAAEAHLTDPTHTASSTLFARKPKE